MSKTDDLIRAYMDAAAELLQQALTDAAATNPAGVDALRRAVTAGAVLSLHSTFAPAAGLARMSIEYIEPTGTAHNVLSCDLEREAAGG